jgi:hypothetical protein
MKNLVIFSLIFQPLFLMAQTYDEYGEEIIPAKKFFTLQITPYFASKVNYEYLGAALMQSKQLLTGEIGLGATRQIKNNFYLHSKLNLGVVPYNLNFDFDAPEGTIFLTEPWNKYYQRLHFNRSVYSSSNVYLNLDVILSHSVIKFKKQNEVHLGVGLRNFAFFDDRYKRYFSQSYGVSESETDVDLFYAEIKDSITNPMKIGFLFEATYVKIVDNEAKIRTSILFNYSPFNNVQGYYRFSNLGFLSAGNFNQSLTTLGIRFSYLIPRRKTIFSPKPE